MRVRYRKAASSCCSWDAGEALGVAWEARGLLACIVDARDRSRLRGYEARRVGIYKSVWTR